MPNVIITRSRRGCFSTEELSMFNPPDIVFLKCRTESCGKITTPTIEEFLSIDVDVNPCQCPTCSGYDLTGSWCNFVERPKTYIGSPSTNAAELTEYNNAMNSMATYRGTHGAGANPDWNTPYYKIIRETMWCTTGSPNVKHLNEVFHEFLPNSQGNWNEVAPTSTNPGLFVTRNNGFYRAIINMIIQTEVV